MKRKDDRDDGRTIANMDIDGMPWTTGVRGFLNGSGKRRRDSGIRRDMYNDARIPEENHPIEQEIVPTAKETMSIWLTAVAAALVVALIFGVIGFLFVLFCTKVWFK